MLYYSLQDFETCIKSELYIIRSQDKQTMGLVSINNLVWIMCVLKPLRYLWIILLDTMALTISPNVEQNIYLLSLLFWMHAVKISWL